MTQASNTDDDAAALRELFRRVLYGVHTSIPGVVTAVSKLKGAKVVSVQPVIQQIDTLDDVPTLKAIDPISNVPLCIPYSQTLGLSMTIPVQVGDEGLIHFAERSLDNWLDRAGVQPPAEPIQPRSHDLTDAVFVPGIVPVPHAIDSWSDDSIEVRNKEGTTALSVSVDTVAMRSGGASIYLPGDGTIHFNGDIVHDSGGLSGSGKLKTHGHPQDNDSAGNTEENTGEAQ